MQLSEEFNLERSEEIKTLYDVAAIFAKVYKQKQEMSVHKFS